MNKYRESVKATGGDVDLGMIGKEENESDSDEDDEDDLDADQGDQDWFTMTANFFSCTEFGWSIYFIVL